MSGGGSPNVTQVESSPTIPKALDPLAKRLVGAGEFLLSPQSITSPTPAGGLSPVNVAAPSSRASSPEGTTSSGGVGNLLASGATGGGTRDPFLESLGFKSATDEFDRFNLPLSQNEELLRQRAIGQLLTRSPDEDIAGQTLRETVSGDFLSPESNPFLQSQIDIINENLARNINSIISRAGVEGAGGGARERVLQGVAASF